MFTKTTIIMTNLEVKFYERVPSELHRLNENLQTIINILNGKCDEEIQNAE